MAHEPEKASQDHDTERPQSAAEVPVFVPPIEPNAHPLNLSWLWDKIKRHKVAEWTLAYVAFAYAFLHGAELLSDAQEWPHVIVRVLSLALVLGVPIVATLAWFHGHRAQHRISRVELLILIVLLACAGGVLWRLSGADREHVAAQSTPASAPELPVARVPSIASTTFNPPVHSVAVLPFTNLSGDPKQEYFSDGVSEELINALTQIDALEVSARTSSFSFKGQNVDIGTIARKLNVAAILEGSIRRSGNTVRITAQLINTVNGFHMWSRDYDRDLKNILALQTEVAAAVAQQLQVKLLGDEAEKIEAGGTKNPPAHDAYLRGLQIMSAAENAAEFRSGLADFDEAIALDPNYALAHAARALALMDIGGIDTNIGTRLRTREQAQYAAQKAVFLAPDLADAHVALGYVHTIGFLNFSAGAPEFSRAFELAPGSARVEATFALFSSWIGHHEVAIQAQRRAVRLDPQNYNLRINLALILMAARRFDDAIAATKDARILKPDGQQIGYVISSSRLALGQTTLAKQMCESPATSIDESNRHACLALAYHRLGRRKDAEDELRKMQALDGDSYAFEYATIFAQWGNTDAAIEWLTTADRLYDGDLEGLKNTWKLDPIRGDPRFKALEKRMNYPP